MTASASHEQDAHQSGEAKIVAGDPATEILKVAETLPAERMARRRDELRGRSSGHANRASDTSADPPLFDSFATRFRCALRHYVPIEATAGDAWA